MLNDIKPVLKLISEYLGSKERLTEKFVIPEYQRRYSWTKQECDKLWQDIETYKDSGQNEPYFFGTVIVACSVSEPDRICLIDGQQRTTTFILLLKALLFRMKEKLENMENSEETRRLKVAMEKRSSKILDILYRTTDDSQLNIIEDWNNARGIVILESNSNNEPKEFKRDFQIILDAENYVEAEARCYKIPRKQKENKYTNFFRNFKYFYDKLELDSTAINEFAKVFLEACQIIEIRCWDTEQAIAMFNSLNSTGMPLSDSDIISAQLYSKAKTDAHEADFNDKWKNITMLAEDLASRKIASLDSLLQQYMYIQRAARREYMRPGAQPDVTTPGMRRYFTVDKRELLTKPMDFCEQIEKLAMAWGVVSDWPVVKLLLKFNENAKLYLISFLNRFGLGDINEALTHEIAEALIKLFAILEVVDTGYSSSKFKTFLFGENVKLVDPMISADEIERDFRKHIDETWKREDIEESLLEYDKNILVFLNEYLYAKSHGLPFDFPDSVNIEHIMPSSGHNRPSIMKDAGIESPDDFTIIANRLGNKILLEEDINKSIQDDWFRTKKQTSVRAKKGYKDSSYGLACSLVNYQSDKWTKNEIDKATKKAVCRIADFIFSK
ncbi:MAG: DUF262 domain-containing protein [Kiritimatiellae bacterium]|nr:DUF262 domain-containing protein [Kiritimatiellia bacterium]